VPGKTLIQIAPDEQARVLRELRAARYDYLLALQVLLLCASGRTPSEIRQPNRRLHECTNLGCFDLVPAISRDFLASAMDRLDVFPSSLSKITLNYLLMIWERSVPRRCTNVVGSDLDEAPDNFG
jgi:hypothetical protein